MRDKGAGSTRRAALAGDWRVGDWEPAGIGCGLYLFTLSSEGEPLGM